MALLKCTIADANEIPKSFLRYTYEQCHGFKWSNQNDCNMLLWYFLQMAYDNYKFRVYFVQVQLDKKEKEEGEKNPVNPN